MLTSVPVTARPFDNSSLTTRILQLRQEKAQLLGFDSYADMMLTTQIQHSTHSIVQLLDQLNSASTAQSSDEQHQLSTYIATQGGAENFAAWDIRWWERQLRNEQLGIDGEELRHYFPLPRVLAGLFKLLNEIAGFVIKEDTATAQIWHPDVKFYRVYAADGAPIAAFYFDPYSRPHNKAGGAWLSTSKSSRGNSPEVPVYNIIANLPPPVADKPALLDTHALHTLFHQFGYVLQAMLPLADYVKYLAPRADTNDSIDMPGNVLENFIYTERVMTAISSHVDNGKPLPAAIRERLQQSKNFRIAGYLRRQLFFNHLDIILVQ